MPKHHHHYQPISREAQMDILTYCLMRAAGGEDADTTLLFQHVRYGSISWAQVEMPGCASADPHAPEWKDGDAPRVAFKMGERNPRYVDLEAFLMLLVLTMFGGHPFIDNVSPRNPEGPSPQKELHYVELLNPTGTRLHRIISGAGKGEVAELGSDHYDLRAQSLKVIRGKADSTRDTVMQAAMAQYYSAVNDGQTRILSPSAYGALVQLTFKLLNDNHGHKVKRLCEEDQEAVRSAGKDVTNHG